MISVTKKAADGLSAASKVLPNIFGIHQPQLQQRHQLPCGVKQRVLFDIVEKVFTIAFLMLNIRTKIKEIFSLCLSIIFHIRIRGIQAVCVHGVPQKPIQGKAETAQSEAAYFGIKQLLLT